MLNKKHILSAMLVFIFSAGSFALPTLDAKNPTDSKTIEEITSLISKMDVDLDEPQTVKVYFLINSADEVVVVRTDNDEMESQIASRLNYKKINEMDLEMNKIYVLPVKFQ